MAKSLIEDTINQQELKDYNDYKKRYNLWGILLGLLILLFSIPLIDWFFKIIFNFAGTTGIPQDIIKYISPLVVLLAFIAGILPMINSRWKLYKKYKWSKQQQITMSREIDQLPKGYFAKLDRAENKQQGTGTTIKGPPKLLLVIVFSLLGLVVINEYTEYKPVDYLMGQLNIGTAQMVSGRYETHYDQTNMGAGVARADQTWSFEFYSNGKYTTYLEGSQQFSGTWSQTGTTLTVNFPAIAGLNQKGYSAKAKVSSDASYFLYGGDGIKYEKVTVK